MSLTNLRVLRPDEDDGPWLVGVDEEPFNVVGTVDFVVDVHHDENGNVSITSSSDHPPTEVLEYIEDDCGGCDDDDEADCGDGSQCHCQRNFGLGLCTAIGLATAGLAWMIWQSE